jgi:translocation and assembly module TamB
MKRLVRIGLFAAGAVILLIAIVTVTVVFVARSDWLREKARGRIVAEAEKATGGRVEISAFKFDWRTLRAELDHLIVHGREPSGQAPLLTVDRATVGLRIISLMQREFDVALVSVEHPQVHVIVDAGGMTNIPEPKVSRAGKSGVETILALKIGKFELAGGTVLVESPGSSRNFKPWNARAENLVAHVSFDSAGPRYDAGFSAAPLRVAYTGLGPLEAQVSATLAIEKNRLTISKANLKTGASEVEITSGLVNSFTSPVTTAWYQARLSLADADRIFKLVNFRHTGVVNVSGNARYVSPDDYVISGEIRGSGIGYGKVRNIAVAGQFSGAPDRVDLKNVRVRALGGSIFANGDIRKLEAFHIAGQLDHFDAQDLAALGGTAPLPYDGLLSGRFDATGKLSETNFHDIVGDATLTISPAGSGVAVRGEVAARYDGTVNTVELSRSWIELPRSRVDFAGVLGKQLQVKFESADLNDFGPALNGKALPVSFQNGSASFDGSVAGPLGNPQISGHAALRNFIYNSEKIDALTADFMATSAGVTANSATFALGGLQGMATGSLGLSDWKPTDESAVNATLKIKNAEITKLSALAGQNNFPVRGVLAANAQVNGTLRDPRVSADITAKKGQIYGEPYDSLTGHVQYLNGSAGTITAALASGAKHVNFAARLDRAPGTSLAGKLTFNISSNAIALGEIRTVHTREPDLRGVAQIKADGAIDLKPKTGHGGLDGINIVDLNANVNLSGLGFGPRNFGNAQLTATTRNGVVSAIFDSSLVNAPVHGEASVELSGNYPAKAKLTFSKAGLGALAALVSDSGAPNKLNFDGAATGEVILNGLVRSPEQMAASLEVTQFEMYPVTAQTQPAVQKLVFRNNGPIRVALSKSVVRVESAHFEAPQTDLTLSGAIALNQKSPVELQVRGSVNLALAEDFNTDLTSSGQLNISAAIRGSLTAPDVSGRAELRGGDFHYADFTNGLTNANGVILFNGSRATIQTLTAETGGGSIEANGFAALTASLVAFRLETRARGVRIRYPEGVSSSSDADLTVAGTSQRSQASGTVTIRRVSINPKSDAAAILAHSTEPIRTPPATTGLAANMNLDIQVETASDVVFETSVAQSIQADANLRVRGTLINPAVLGRINITQGELVFFGNKYSINQGSVSFFNPARIEPILDVDLETKARGVDVILTVTGPINKLSVSYRSDPPLEFSDIIALLATGRTPGDPTLALRDTGQSQNLQQLGASALIGQAIATPVAGRLQRFFGVSRIKIDPQLTGVTGSPQARLTVEQQVTPDLLFTYVSDVSNTSTQLIRVQWDFNRRWSAILTRAENGYVDLDFAFKKQFK